jgi:hypothetical protein
MRMSFGGCNSIPSSWGLALGAVMVSTYDGFRVEAAHAWPGSTAVEIHRELIRDHNRLPHFAHHKRNDQKRAPLEVLSQAKGREVDAATLHRAFSWMTWKRKTDERGFVRINRWRIYVEEGLPRARTSHLLGWTASSRVQRATADRVPLQVGWRRQPPEGDQPTEVSRDAVPIETADAVRPAVVT